jgi:putative spermidine/putrescine transport system substrate-binding protein
MKRVVFLTAILAMLLAACGSTGQPGAGYDINDWDSMLAAAKGQTVNWYIWGGSDSINAYVDNSTARH